LSRFSQLSEEIFRYSEFHENGISSTEMEFMLGKIGFKNFSIEYHWYGLSSLTNSIFGRHTYQRGYAPLVRIVAIK